MAIDKKLIYCKTKTQFNAKHTAKEFNNSSIVFIEDTGELWTHGIFIGGSYSSATTNKVALLIAGKSYNLALDGHKQDYTTLTGSTTTGDQAIVSSGVANGWALKTLGKNAFSNDTYLLATGTAVAATNIAGGVQGSIPYQTAASKTSLLAPPTNSGWVLKYNTTNKIPYWAEDLNTVYTAQNININGANYGLYTTAASLPTIKAPVNFGTANQILATNSTANGLVWTSIPATSKPILNSSIDWDGIFNDNNWGFFTGLNKSPVGEGSSAMGISIPLLGSGGYGMQLAARNGKFYFRTKEANVNGPWYLMYHTGNKPAWADIQSKPTTVAGYGITNTYTSYIGTITLADALSTTANAGRNIVGSYKVQHTGYSSHLISFRAGGSTDILQLWKDNFGTSGNLRYRNSTDAVLSAPWVTLMDAVNFSSYAVSLNIAQTVNGAKTFSSAVTAPSFIKAGASVYQILKANGGVATFTWASQTGQPTYLWGGDTHDDYKIYNPTNFSVASSKSFTHMQGTNVNGGWDANALVPVGGGISTQYGSYAYWKNTPSGLGYGTILTLGYNTQGSLRGQFAWDIDHNVDNGRNGLFFRTSNNLGWNATWDRILTDRTWASVVDGRYLPLTGGTLTGQLNTNSVIRTSNWFDNSASGIGLYNSAQDARWRAQNGRWEADKQIYSSSNFVAGNTALCTNLNADLLDGVHFKDLYIPDGKLVAVTGTVASKKAELVTYFANYTTGIGANATISVSVIDQWSNDSAALYPSSVYSMIKISGGYSATTYGQWLLSSYNLSSIGVVGRNNNVWSNIKWLAFITDNVASATQLQTPRTLWGQSFNGTANVDGSIIVTTVTDSALRVDSAGINKAAYGWVSNMGTYVYNYPSSKYMGIKDDGTPHFHGSTLWHAGNLTGNQTAHSHDVIKNKPAYGFTSATLPNSLEMGITAGFVNSGSGFGNYGTVLNVRTHSEGGGTLQLYTPYGLNHGGSRLKARFGNYDVSSGNSWTALKELAWVTDMSEYLPLVGGTMTGGIKFNSNNNGDANRAAADGFRLFYNHTTGSNFPSMYTNMASFMTGYSGFQLASGGGSDQILYFRKYQDNGVWHPWHTVLHTGNYTTTLDSRYVNVVGDTMTGLLTWNMSGITSSIGNQNNSFMHFTTNSASGFHFNREAHFTGNVYGGTNYQRRLAYVDEINAQVGGSKSAQMLWSNWNNSDVYGGAIQIREWNNVGNAQSAWLYAPALTFHWGNRHAKRFGLRSDGQFAIDDVPITLSSHNHNGAYVPLRISSNWSDNTVINNVVGLLGWKKYGNAHVIFDASNSTSPNGVAINSTNPQINWAAGYPTLMGWNGAATYGVRVDSARISDTTNIANVAKKLGRGGDANLPMVFHWSGQAGQPTWLWGGTDGTSMYVYNPSNFSVNYAATAGSTTSAQFLSINYKGGIKSNPQDYFNNNTGVKVAMTGHLRQWSDTLWINGYNGSDVPYCTALHFSRDTIPEMYISTQQSTSTVYGHLVRVRTTGNCDDSFTPWTCSTLNTNRIDSSFGKLIYRGDNVLEIGTAPNFVDRLNLYGNTIEMIGYDGGIAEFTKSESTIYSSLRVEKSLSSNRLSCNIFCQGTLYAKIPRVVVAIYSGRIQFWDEAGRIPQLVDSYNPLGIQLGCTPSGTGVTLEARIRAVNERGLSIIFPNYNGNNTAVAAVGHIYPSNNAAYVSIVPVNTKEFLISLADDNTRNAGMVYITLTYWGPSNW